eukprot:605085_1
MGNHQLTGCVSYPVDHADQPMYSTSLSSRCKRNTEPVSHSSKRNCEPQSISATSVYSSSHPLAPPSYGYHTSSHHSMNATTDHDAKYKRNVKLLFLDVDGVLNNKYLEWTHHNNGLDDNLLAFLKIIVLKTNCKIVLSTTWRLHRKAKQILIHSIKTRLDLNTDDLIVGQTPDLRMCGKNRSDEIENYLTSNTHRYHVVSWCALDDLSLNKYDTHAALFMKGHFVKTSPKIGISATNAVRAIDILNANDFATNSYSYQRAA